VCLDPPRACLLGQAGMTDWTVRAQCRDEDPELFFPPGSFRTAHEQMERARLVCMQCPVIQPCLELALFTASDYGMWGGTTPEERTAIRRRAGREADRIQRRVVRRTRERRNRGSGVRSLPSAVLRVDVRA
jgi:WhiB family redox-sensing transcriptional regulator